MNYFVIKILGKYFTADQWANFIVKETAELAGEVFNEPQFQELSKEKELDQEEQNRIFNEVQVTGLVYSMLFIEQRRQFLDENRAILWREVINKIPDTFCAWLVEIGIEQQYIDVWRKLIDLRLREYKEARFGVRDILEEELRDEEGSDNIKDVYYCLEGVAIGSTLHIMRGKMKRDDFLRRHMKTWLVVLQQDLIRKMS